MSAAWWHREQERSEQFGDNVFVVWGESFYSESSGRIRPEPEYALVCSGDVELVRVYDTGGGRWINKRNAARVWATAVLVAKALESQVGIATQPKTSDSRRHPSQELRR